MGHPRVAIVATVGGAALAVAVGACTLHEPPARIRRLGGDALERVEVAREARRVLARDATHEFAIRLDPACRVHVGAANLTPAGSSTVVVRGTTVDEATTDLLRESLAPASGWTDFVVATAEPEIAALSFVVEPGDPGETVWSRPMVACRERGPASRLRNVLLVSLDTLRADRLAAYGRPRSITPTLDRLAREGAVFERAFAQFPNTLGSHATVFTGLYPSQHGLMVGTFAGIADDRATVARAFADAGYATAAFTENGYVAAGFGFDVGFDRYHNGPGGEPDTTFRGEAAATFARAARWLEGRPDAPFFLFVHTYDVHAPYTPSADAVAATMTAADRGYEGDYETAFDGLRAMAFNHGDRSLARRELRRIELLYDAEAFELDGRVAWLLAQLTRLGLDDSTLVVIFSDHGEEFNEHGFLGHGETLHAQALHVPLLFHLPGVVPPGRRIEAPIGLLDLAPTIADLAGIGPILVETPARSRASWIVGDDRGGAAPVISELDAGAVQCAAGEPDGGPSGLTCPYGAVAVRDRDYTYIDIQASGERRLYDAVADPGERENLNAAEPATAARYRAIVDEYRKEAHPTSARGAERWIDDTTEDRLRALGYVP